MAKIKKFISYLVPVIVCILIFVVLAAPEISDFFKGRGLPSNSDLKQSAIKKFDEYKINLGDSDQEKTTFAETGSTKFPYSMSYKYFINSMTNDEKLYFYNQDQEDWILVSETVRTFDNHVIKTVSDWDVISQ